MQQHLTSRLSTAPVPKAYSAHLQHGRGLNHSPPLCAGGRGLQKQRAARMAPKKSLTPSKRKKESGNGAAVSPEKEEPAEEKGMSAPGRVAVCPCAPNSMTCARYILFCVLRPKDITGSKPAILHNMQAPSLTLTTRAAINLRVTSHSSCWVASLIHTLTHNITPSLPHARTTGTPTRSKEAAPEPARAAAEEKQQPEAEEAKHEEAKAEAGKPQAEAAAAGGGPSGSAAQPELLAGQPPKDVVEEGRITFIYK